MGGRPTNNSYFSADNIPPEVCPARDEAGSFELPVHRCRQTSLSACSLPAGARARFSLWGLGISFVNSRKLCEI